MRPPPANTALRVSQWVYRCCLLLYPKAHRAAFGEAMAQLFRDQCREARRDKSWLGLAALWFRVLPDLFRSSLVEHLPPAQAREARLSRLARILLRRSGSSAPFARAGIATLVLLLGATLLAVCLQSDHYSSESRLMVRWVVPDDPISGKPVSDRAALNRIHSATMEREMHLIQSDAVLTRALESRLVMPEVDERMSRARGFSAQDALARLRKRVRVNCQPDAGILRIQATGESAAAAMRLANALVESYLAQNREAVHTGPAKLVYDPYLKDLKPAGTGSMWPRVYGVSVIQRPTPGERMTRHKLFWYLVVGGSGGLLVGWMVASGGALVVRRITAPGCNRIASLNPPNLPAHARFPA